VSDHVPSGFVHDPHDPDAFIVRCPDCGKQDKRQERPGRKSQTCVRCNRLKGVTPVSKADPPATESSREDGQRVMTDGGQDEDPVDVDPEMLQRGLDALETAESSLEELGEEIHELDTGLTHSDTVALLYGRSNSLNKTEIRDAFATLEDARSKQTRTLLKRLLADQSAELNLKEADAFLDELDRLERRYGGESA